LQTYFISDGTLVKIGKSENAEARLLHFQTSHAQHLKLLLVLSEDREQELHKKFAAYHKRGEWFWLSNDIEDFIVGYNPQYQRRTFHAWIISRHKQPDAIGRLAREILKDPYYPREANKLAFLLRYYDGARRSDASELRKTIKRAHREWREFLSWKKAQPAPVDMRPRLVKKPTTEAE